MYGRLKREIFEIIQPAGNGRIASRIFDFFIIALIFFSIASVFIMTFDISPKTAKLLIGLERTALVIFSAEYLLRIWTADMLYPDMPGWRARLRYVRSGMALIDLVAILPFYLPVVLPMNLVGIRAVRLVRLLRLFKLNRYTEALSAIGEVFRSRYREMLVSMFFVAILLVIASLLIYYAEHDAQPDKFSNAFSGLWWAVATLTTVGYGDICPVTMTGRLLGSVIALMGIGMVAIPTGIFSSGFIELLERKRSAAGNPGSESNAESAGEAGREADSESGAESGEARKYCPWCGKKL